MGCILRPKAYECFPPMYTENYIGGELSTKSCPDVAGVTEVVLVGKQIDIFQVIALYVLLAVALARPQNGYGVPTPSSVPAKYDFNYAVNDPPSGNDFGHQEARDGPNTQGSYYVLLPDGRLQRVTYTVNGDSGYLAETTYEGEAQYPSTPRPYTPAPQYA
ncbi:pro-resilin-like [Penaeus monodon]|uniref:pro-resilin-like n=1 Tax=Penaeus monodon TaxID=6687 RepID=UPI0018A6D44A|nr:pro-resilin-like [Penaeus monodon]